MANIPIILLSGPRTGNLKNDWPLFREWEDKLIEINLVPLNILRVFIGCWRRMGTKIKPEEVKLSQAAWQWQCEQQFLMGGLMRTQGLFLIPGFKESANGMFDALTAQKMGLTTYSFKEGNLIQHAPLNLSVNNQPIKSDNQIVESENPDDCPELTCGGHPLDEDFNPLTIITETEQPSESILENVTSSSIGDWLERQLGPRQPITGRSGGRKRQSKKSPKNKPQPKTGDEGDAKKT